MKKNLLFLSIWITLFWAAFPAVAGVRLPAIFSGNMVLQRERNVPVWGWATPGEQVGVAIAGRNGKATAGSDGRWMVRLGTLEAGGPYELIVTGSSDTITLKNVMIGDVWVCSGQSNMEMRVRHVNNSDVEVAEALIRNIRLFQITNDLSPEPRDDCDGTWEVCRPSTIGDFSAAGYFCGRMLMEELGVPIGLINASWGGTTVEAWMSREAGEHCPAFRGLLEYWEPALREKPSELLDFYRKMAEWEEDVHYVLYVGKEQLAPYGEVPERSIPLAIVPQMPMWVYHAMVAPLVPYGIKGVLWYQGESNTGRAYQYRELFPALIENWRSRWGQENLPFIFVQLANIGQHVPQPGESPWAELREAQLMTLSIPRTAMAVTIDIGEADNIHPRNKQEVGRRLALGALKVAYGRNVVSSGPLYDSMNVQDGKVHISFTETGSGLLVKGDSPLRGFAIAGEDRKFVWADAQIEGDKVAVSSQAVPHPVAVRYGWESNPDCNLYNREGLPASPFRTDDWPDVTAEKR